MKRNNVGYGLVATAAAVVAAMAAGMAQAAGGEGAAEPKKSTNVTATASAGNPKIVIETSLGTIKVDLWADKAPGTVSNMLKYVDDKFYDSLVFHRVINGFMIQGGGFSADMRQKMPTYGNIKNEAKSDVKNVRGTLAMARTPAIDGATCQWFINLVDNNFLDHTDDTVKGFGYCVFGKVVEGMDVVDAIAKVPASKVERDGSGGVPNEPVIIKSIRRDQPAPAAK